MNTDNGSRTTVNDRTLTAPTMAGPSLLARCPVVPVVVLDHQIRRIASRPACPALPRARRARPARGGHGE